MKNTANLLDENLATLFDLFGSFPSPLIMVQRQEGLRRVIFVNKQFQQQIGYSVAEIPILEAWYRVAYPNDDLRASLMMDMLQNLHFESTEEGYHWEIKRKIYCKDSVERWFQVKIGPWKGDLELMLFNNIDELERKNQELDKLNKLKDKLFSVISHDVRNPLVALRQLIDLLEEKGISEEDLKAFIPSISQQLYHVTNSLETTLSWVINQMHHNRLVPNFFCIQKTIKNNVEIFAPEAKRKNITLEAIESNLISVFADEEMIGLVIRNLIANAIKFTPPGGYISVAYQESNRFAIVKVKDNGIGMSKVTQQKILDKEIFTTLGTDKEKDTGLGLSFCQEFIALNGGSLWIDSEVGKGSEFNFNIPLDKQR
jgi:signal transduction histidine kinase